MLFVSVVSLSTRLQHIHSDVLFYIIYGQDETQRGTTERERQGKLQELADS